METDYRWLRIDVRDVHLHPTAIAWGDTGFFHVLQIREREGPVGESWWGEWHDIPVVDAR